MALLPRHQKISLMESVSVNFDPDNPKYKFCCESLKATYGAIVVGIIQLAIAVALFCHVIVENRENVIAVSCVIGLLVLTILIVGVSFYGIKFDKALFIFPFLVMQVFEIIGFVVASIILIFFLLDRLNNEEIEESRKVAGLVYVIGCAFAAAFETWFFAIVLSCYRYLLDKTHYQPVDV